MLAENETLGKVFLLFNQQCAGCDGLRIVFIITFFVSMHIFSYLWGVVITSKQTKLTKNENNIEVIIIDSDNADGQCDGIGTD